MESFRISHLISRACSVSAIIIFLVSSQILIGCTPKQQVTYSPSICIPSISEHQADLQPERIGIADPAHRHVEALLNLYFQDWQGTPYKLGGLTHRGVDCSGFTLRTYREIFGLNLPRTAREQARWGEKVDVEKLQPGDLLFFKTGMFQRHVGIFLNNSDFVHASRSKGVTVSRLDDDYWQQHFWQARRLDVAF